MRPVRFTVQNAVGQVIPALHPDKHNALREILGKSKAKAQSKAKRKKVAAPESTGSSLIDNLYRLNDPVVRQYFQKGDV